MEACLLYHYVCFAESFLYLMIELVDTLLRSEKQLSRINTIITV